MTLRLIAVAAAALVAGAVAVAAQTPSQSPARVEDACKTEVASLCAASGDKRGAINRCLNENQAKLGAECSGAIKAAQERRQKLQVACKADSDKLCGGVQPKGGNFVACLRGKTAELSKDCADAIAALPAPAAKK